MTRTFVTLMAVVVVLVCASTVRAQTGNRFAIGAEIEGRGATGDDARRSSEVGPLWRIGHDKTGWGWQYGLNWYAADLTRSIGGTQVDFGELRVRPLLGGYGYTKTFGRYAVTGDLVAGYAFARFSMATAASDAYRDQLGARAVDSHASNTLVVKPEINTWIDLNRKMGVNINAGYLIARPRITVRSSLGEESQRFQADSFLLNVGLVYRLF